MLKDPFLAKVKGYFGVGADNVEPTPGQRLRLAGRGTRIRCRGFAFSVEMGPQRLHVYPDFTLDNTATEEPHDYVVVDPERVDAGICHTLRLKLGQTLSIDRDAPYQAQVFSHPRDAFRRHLQISHQGDALVFRDPISELGSYVTRIEDPVEAGKIGGRRQHALHKVADIYGGPLAPLAPETALTTLQAVNHLLRSEPYRQPDSQDNAGGVLELPDHLAPILVSDLHGRVDNLLVILSENAYLESLERGDAALVFLGDTVHREDDGYLDSMESSALLMDLIFKLKLRFPSGVFMLLGNHESFSPDVMKGGIPQGLLWSRWITASRGEEYREALEILYQQLPLVALSKEFGACHAGPPRAKVSREMLIDVRRFPGLVHEMTWTRLCTPRYPGGYTKGDVRRFRKSLGLSKEVPIIVGHTPKDRDSTLWLNVADIPNHHIAFCAMPDKLAVFARVDGVMVPQIYPVRPTLDWLRRHEHDG